MYGKLRDYFDDKIGKLAASAIVSHGSGREIEVGAPCLLDFTNVQIKRYHDKISINKMFEAKDPIAALNKFLCKAPIEVPVTYLFPTNGLPYAYRDVCNGDGFYCINKKPIIRDVYKSNVVKSFGGITPAKNLPKLPTKISEAFKKYRYVNYTLHNLCASNADATLNQLYKIMDVFTTKYPNNTCVYLRGNGKGTLIDTLSISFYKLVDAMPIFDSKRVSGVAIELLFTNSLLSGSEILENNNNYMIIRVLLSRYRDNLFTIDGERINRAFEKSIFDILDDHVHPLLKKSTPDDTALKKAKPNKEGENLCAE